MMKKSIAHKALYPIAATALIVGGSFATAGTAGADGAKDLLSDNVHNNGSGGMTNCNGGDVCVEKVGDELEVSYEVQLGSMLRSSDHGQTVRGSMIAFPSVIKDPKLEIIATGRGGTDSEYSYGGSDEGVTEYSYPAHKFDNPVSVPAYAPEELEGKGIAADSGEVSLVVPEGQDYNQDSSYIKKHSPENENIGGEDKFFATHLSGKKIIEDFAKTGGSGNMVQGFDEDAGLSKDAEIYETSLKHAGVMTTDSPYDYFIFNNETRDVQTFRVTGKVKTQSDLAYLPIRAKQGFWKCSQEGGGFGSYEEGCTNIVDENKWARSDDSLPKYSLKNDEVTQSNIQNDTKHGLLGAQKCAVTGDRGRYDRIEQDIEPRELDSSGSMSWADSYTKTYQLHANRAVTYVLSGAEVAEDGCDQAGVEISLCTEKEPDKTPSTEPNPPTPTDPQEPSNTTSTPPQEPSRTAFTPLVQKDGRETSPEKTSTPSTTQAPSVQTPGNNLQQPNIPNAYSTPGALGISTAERPKTNMPPYTASNQPATQKDIPAAGTIGPKVNTGGEAESLSLFDKISQIFR